LSVQGSAVLLFGFKPVADARLGLQVSRTDGVGLDLVAKLVNEDPHRLGRGIAAFLPDCLPLLHADARAAMSAIGAIRLLSFQFPPQESLACELPG
jgi:hypothetical protein